jgi:hypothetical protein
LHGVYWSSVSITLRPPALAHQVVPESSAPIPLAAVVERLVRAEHGGPPAVSPNLSIVDRGIYDGWTVELPDYGGQWAVNVTSPTLIIQASGSNPRIVVDRISKATARVDQLLDHLQSERGVSAENRVRAERLQPTIDVNYAVGSTTRAMISVAALGGLVGVLGSLAVDRLARSPWDRRRQPSAAARSIAAK